MMRVTTGLVGLLFALPLGAQDTVVVARPGSVATSPAARRAAAVFNATATVRVFGPHTIGVDRSVAGDVGVLDGPLLIEGAVQGDVMSLNGDVTLAAGAEVRGDVLVLGGVLNMHPDAFVFGVVERHSARVALRRVGDRIELIGEPSRVPDRWRFRVPRRTSRRADASIVLTTGRTYNRVEGLPILVGPRLQWTGRNLDLRIDGLGVFRTEMGFSTATRELGYLAAGRLRLGSNRLWRAELGGRVYDLVTPFERWQLSDVEVGWGTLLFHRDYRDYYLARGVEASARVHPTRDVSLYGTVGRFEAVSTQARDPWTPFRGGEVWRSNPAVDEGDFTVFTAGIEFDQRSSYWGPWRSGIYLKAEWERGVGDNVSPRALPLSVRDPIPSSDWTYDRGFVDLRLYQPLGLGGLHLRAVGAGTLGSDPLPVQRRFALGGPGSLPGYAFRHFTCDPGIGDAASPGLCDRMLLLQAEYRTGLDFEFWDWEVDRHGHFADDDWGPWDWDWDGPQVVLFADAGSGWLADRNPGPGALHWDIGAGIEFGSVGIYGARALEADEPVRITLRVQHRF